MTSSYQSTPYIWPMVTAIGLTVAVGIYSWRHRSVPGAAGFSFVSFFWVLKLIASTLGLIAGEFATKVFWFQIEGLFLLPAEVAALAFALGYAGLDTWLNRRTLTLLAIPALLLIPLSFTNYYTQHLISAHDWLDIRIRYTPGVFGYVFLGYGLLVDVATLTVLIWLFIRSPLHRWPVSLIFLNIFIAHTLYFLVVAGVNPVKPLDPLDLAVNFMCPVYFVALFHFRLFEVVPVARNRVIEQMRDGIRPMELFSPTAPDIVSGTSTSLILDALAIMVDSRKAEGLKFKYNFILPDINEKFVVEMSNATLTYIEGYEAKDADLSVTLNRSDLEDIMLGKAKLSELAKAGRAKLEGNANVLQQLAAACEMFDPMFEIMPGTKRVVETPKAKEEVFKQDTPRPHEP